MVPANPIIYLFANVAWSKAITLVDLDFEAITPATNKIEFLVRELAPLGLNLGFGLFPHSFNSVPIHRIPRLSRS